MEFHWAISNPKRWFCESAALSMPANMENSAGAAGLEMSIFIPIPRRAIPKNVYTAAQLHSFHMLATLMLKILQARLQQYVNWELPDVQAGFIKGRGTRDQIANIHWGSWKKQESPEKHLFLPYWLYQSLSLCGSQQTVENSSRDGNTRPLDLPP